MNLIGGLRKNIREYDFKYTYDNTRRNWIKSVFPFVETLVNIVANIPYNTYTYKGDIVYTFCGEIENDDNNDDKLSISTIEEIKEEIIKNDTFTLDKNNSVNYTFFGGICFELLNDAYPNVNLYDFVDPTSDIDIVITTIISKLPDNVSEVTSELNKIYSKYYKLNIKVNLVVINTLEDPNLEPYLNPYFEHLSDFIFNQMLLKLNETPLNFENSISFDIDEYDAIVSDVKNERLGYKVEDIKNSNAKLVRYLDSDLKILRIQIILKVVVDGETIIDHLLEFLINDSIKTYEPYDKHIITIPEKKNWTTSPPLSEETIERHINTGSIIQDQQITISNFYTLINDNLEAYIKRESEALVEGPRRHKPINHITRIIYLLDLFKNNPMLYDSLNIRGSSQQGAIRRSIEKNLARSYIYYKIINDKFIIKHIDTINIVYAFYTLFVKLMQTDNILKKIFEKTLKVSNLMLIKEEDKKKELEKHYYNSLMSLFKMNASPFRKIISTHKPQETPETQIIKQMVSRKLDNIDKEQEAKKNSYGGKKTRRRKHKKKHRKTYKRHKKRTQRYKRN